MVWTYLGGVGSTRDWSSAELLAQLRVVTKRPANDQDLTDARAYVVLSEAQQQLARILAAHIPHVNYLAPEKLTTPDAGFTYVALNDVLGKAELFADKLRSEPLIEGPVWSFDADYCLEGTKTFRMTGGRARTFADGPWLRYMTLPGVIDDNDQPTLQPLDCRAVIVMLAAAKWAQSGAARDPRPYLDEALAVLWGDPEMGYAGLIPSEKQRMAAWGGGRDSALWYRSRDLG